MRFAVVTLAALLLCAPLAAELTLAEKAELQKLYKANTLVSGAWNDMHNAGSPGNSYRFATTKTALMKACQWLLHTHGSLLGYEQVQYPAAYGDPIPDRAAVIQQGFDSLDTARSTLVGRIIAPLQASGPQSALNKANEALALIDSFDRTLAYENPLLPTFPLQFGPHGDYPTAQRALGEARRLLGYVGAHLAWYRLVVADETIYYPTEPENLPHYKSFAKAWGEAFDMIHRTLLLSGHVPALPSDAALLEDELAGALMEVKIASLLAPPKFVAAAQGLDKMTPHGGNALANAARLTITSWRYLDDWLWRFLQIVE